MYSIGVVYNTFPMPPKGEDMSRLEPRTQAVLDARAAHPGATLADLYDPDLMPPNLRRAHQALDRAVDRLYRRTGFASERERVEHLFMLYEKMQAPLAAQPKRRRRRRPWAWLSLAGFIRPFICGHHRELRDNAPGAHKPRLEVNVNGVDPTGWPGGATSATHGEAGIDATVAAFVRSLNMLGAEGELQAWAAPRCIDCVRPVSLPSAA